jgi:threonylcarbamoyladenosine tRNA methylthiotransferase CDKAL1
MPNIYVKSYGCSANTADEEIAKGLLQSKGYRLAQKQAESDLNILLTCIVKTPTERKITKRIKRLYASGKPLIVAGCMPKAMQSHAEKIAPNASLVGPDDIEHIVEAVEKTLRGEKAVYVDGDHTDRTCLPRVRANDLIHIAPICSGCLGNCSYCIVKNARGRLCSYPADEIVDDVRRAVDGGCREVWVTAEDAAAYNHNGTTLPTLLDEITGIEGRFRVRVGMMTPNSALPILDELIESYRSDKIFKFLHIPVQSGNDDVLRDMRRRYTVEEFKGFVARFRAAHERLGVSTDIICGFPGESEEQFQDSLDLIQWLAPDVLNISRYWERPGTEAASMPGRLHGRDTKARSRRLTKVWKKLSVETGERWVGWEGEILLDEYGRDGTKVGRNYAYKAVAVETDTEPGEYIRVIVTGAGVGYLEAEIA